MNVPVKLSRETKLLHCYTQWIISLDSPTERTPLPMLRGTVFQCIFIIFSSRPLAGWPKDTEGSTSHPVSGQWPAAKALPSHLRTHQDSLCTSFHLAASQSSRKLWNETRTCDMHGMCTECGWYALKCAKYVTMCTSRAEHQRISEVLANSDPTFTRTSRRKDPAFDKALLLGIELHPEYCCTNPGPSWSHKREHLDVLSPLGTA